MATRRIPGFCALCRSRCGCVSVVEDGRLVAVEPDPSHPTGANLCVKGRAAPELVYAEDRLHMAYNASKGAVRIMTKSGAVQYARDGIRVNSVHPGFMPPMRTSKVSADPAWRQPFLDTVPMKREGRVEEVAHAVLFLASDEASYITGIEVPVDGGFLAM